MNTIIISTHIEKIKLYLKKVWTVTTPENSICPKCKKNPLFFKVHHRRPRIFLVIEKNVVKKISTVLIRWRCGLCKACFTEYPDWALPYKRYTCQMIDTCQSYCEKEDTSYRKLVQDEEEKPLHYEIEETTIPDKRKEWPDVIEDKEISPTTLWNWVGYIGSLKTKLLKAFSLIKEKCNGTEIHKKSLPVSDKKYKSRDRETLLETCRRIFLVEQEFRKIFFKKSLFFPDF